MASKKAPLVQAPEGEARRDLEFAFARMLEARKLAEDYEREWKAIRDNVSEKVVEHGDHTKPEVPADSILQIGSHKVQWVGSMRPSFDQGRGFKFLGTPSETVPEAVRQALYQELVVMVPTLDKDRYAVALKEGRVPQEMREAVEVEQASYCLKYWPVKE
jgi:hypothetical protein